MDAGFQWQIESAILWQPKRHLHPRKLLPGQNVQTPKATLTGLEPATTGSTVRNRIIQIVGKTWVKSNRPGFVAPTVAPHELDLVQLADDLRAQLNAIPFNEAGNTSPKREPVNACCGKSSLAGATGLYSLNGIAIKRGPTAAVGRTFAGIVSDLVFFDYID